MNKCLYLFELRLALLAVLVSELYVSPNGDVVAVLGVVVKHFGFDRQGAEGQEDNCR